MRVLLAPDKFKGTFTSAEICDLLAEGIRQGAAGVQVISHPMADGGDGTLEIVLAARGGERLSVQAPGPLGGLVTAPAALLADGSCLIESARFCGAAALAGRAPDPIAASSEGLGVAILKALACAPRTLLVGLGGSVTIDGGLGMARVLGYKLRGRDGALLAGRGGDLAKLAAIDPEDAAPVRAPVVALADVSHRLLGASGAARTFGAQKGAGREEIEVLERGLSNLVDILRRDLGLAVDSIAGGGAAGGLGAGMVAFLGARITPGAAAVADMTGLQANLQSADVVVTGEGAFDGRHEGKVAHEIACRCAALGRPLILVCARCEGPPLPGRVSVMTLGGEVDRAALILAGKVLAGRGFSGPSQMA